MTQVEITATRVQEPEPILKPDRTFCRTCLLGHIGFYRASDLCQTGLNLKSTPAPPSIDPRSRAGFGAGLARLWWKTRSVGVARCRECRILELDVMSSNSWLRRAAAPAVVARSLRSRQRFRWAEAIGINYTLDGADHNPFRLFQRRRFRMRCRSSKSRPAHRRKERGNPRRAVKRLECRNWFRRGTLCT